MMSMKLSRFIVKLQKIKEENGDIDVYISMEDYDGYWCDNDLKSIETTQFGEETFVRLE